MVKDKSQSRLNYNTKPIAENVASFWRTHKVDVAASVNGYFGPFGLSLGIHFHPIWTVDLGFGGSSHFQAVGARLKRSFLMSSPLAPYVAAGISRWQRTNGTAFRQDDVSPSFLVRRLMSESDKQANRIDEQLLHMAVGFAIYIHRGELEELWLQP